MIKKVFHSIFTPWWMPILLSLFPAAFIWLHGALGMNRLIPFIWISPLPFLVLLIFLIATLYRLFRKHWWQAAITGIPILILVVLIAIFASNFEKHTVEHRREMSE